jgi:hypothetical protein
MTRFAHTAWQKASTMVEGTSSSFAYRLAGECVRGQENQAKAIPSLKDPRPPGT